MLHNTHMDNALIELTGEAAAKWLALCPASQQEVVDITIEALLGMPVEPETEWQTSEQSTSDTSKAGLIKTFTRRSSMSSVVVAVLVLLCSKPCLPTLLAQSQVDNRLLAAVLQVESAGRHTARGDLNKATGEHRALGGYQFWRPTWNHVSQIRQKAGLQTISYDQGATHPAWSREYARSYLRWIEDYIRGRGVHTPTRSQIYAGYNWGVGSFRKVGFDVSKAPATTQRACRKIEALCR